jgi:hypothetical protein
VAGSYERSNDAPSSMKDGEFDQAKGQARPLISSTRGLLLRHSKLTRPSPFFGLNFPRPERNSVSTVNGRSETPLWPVNATC